VTKLSNSGKVKWDETVRREMALSDYNSGMKKAEAEGMAKGEVVGIAKGEMIGIVKVAKAMLRNGFSPEVIAEITGLPLERIKLL
jgi:predicted transposase/invertase (TIGR01784 family)